MHSQVTVQGRFVVLKDNKANLVSCIQNHHFKIANNITRFDWIFKLYFVNNSWHHIHCWIQPHWGAASHWGQGGSRCHFSAAARGMHPTLCQIDFEPCDHAWFRAMALCFYPLSLLRIRIGHSLEGSTTCTAPSRAMSLSLTTWRALRLKRRLTKLDGCLRGMQHSFFCRPMVSIMVNCLSAWE